jgi:hypothetical protein
MCMCNAAWSGPCMPQASLRPRPLCGGEPQWQWQWQCATCPGAEPTSGYGLAPRRAASPSDQRHLHLQCTTCSQRAVVCLAGAVCMTAPTATVHICSTAQHDSNHRLHCTCTCICIRIACPAVRSTKFDINSLQLGASQTRSCTHSLCLRA